MNGPPFQADCARCGHSSDDHVHCCHGTEVTVTQAALSFPCQVDGCDCSTMVRSTANYLELVATSLDDQQ